MTDQDLARPRADADPVTLPTAGTVAPESDRISGRGFVNFQKTRRWLVVRKRDTDAPEVYAFDRYDEAAVFFDRAQMQWTETFFCAVVAGPEQPLRDIPVEWFCSPLPDAGGRIGSIQNDQKDEGFRRGGARDRAEPQAAPDHWQSR